jgi:pseudouridine synthase
LTNDGDWAYRLTHPSYRIPKTYKVTVAGRISEQAVLRLQKGVKIKDEPACRARVTLLGREEDRSLLRLTITQGKSRQVRRMLDGVGFKVIQLLRTGFGNLQLGDLKVGHYRHLEKQEVESIKKSVGLT